MKIESVINAKNNKIYIHITELTKDDFMFGQRWRNFEGRERKKETKDGIVKTVNSKGSRHFAIKISQEQFMSDPLFEELVRRNMYFTELKPNPDYDQEETMYAMEFKIGFQHDPNNEWKDPQISTFNGEEVEEYDEHNIEDLDHMMLVGGEIQCHTYESSTKCSLYIDELMLETNPPRKRESLREKYRAMLQHDESEDEPVPFN